ncbi:hypothetical protein ACFQL1_22505 [Halomicroarcula sp. GCM10025709]|uniref:DUF7344 domain-containing protein n=1 Tax=Haloarcula TaxID=2237 RepID=UPI0024C3DB93|nr:hypothetical protein [Halomicroarcula sp. YJ-61-S]
MAEQTSELSRDRIFDILSSPRRRYVLHYLRTEQSPIQMTDLAEEVAAWENETTVEELSSQDRKRVYVSLYQTHIPKLAEAGLVTYDSDSGDVSLANKSSELDPYIMDEETERPWYLYYLLLAAANVVLVLGVVAGVPVLSALGGTGVGIVVASSFLLLTAVHYLSRRRRGPTTPPGFGEP